MKILCLGDVHLGAGTDYGRVPFGEGSRLEDQRQVLQRIAKLAADEEVDLILFAGDAFHRRRPTPSEILVWREFVDAVPYLVAVDGNHDVESADRPSALETVRGLYPYRVSRRPEVICPYGENAGTRADTTYVATLPWTPPSRLVASLNGQVERDEVNTVCAELLIAAARELRAQIPEEATAILLAHWSVSGSSLPNGLPVDQLREPVLPLPDLEALGFDFIVLGHIHNPGPLGTFPPGQIQPYVFYTGSSAVADFGEAEVAHGAWIIDTEPVAERLRFVPIEDRRFVTVDVDLTTNFELGTLDGVEHAEPYDPRVDEDETDVIAAMIAEQFPLTDAVVRVRYRCTSEQARRVDAAALRALLNDAGVSKVYSLAADVVRGDRARVEGVDENLSEREALDAWIEANAALVGNKADPLRELVARVREGAMA